MKEIRQVITIGGHDSRTTMEFHCPVCDGMNKQVTGEGNKSLACCQRCGAALNLVRDGIGRIFAMEVRR